MSPLIQEMDEGPSNGGSLELTPVESTLRRLLLDVAAYIDKDPVPPQSASGVALPDHLAKEPVILRFTGGWIRDKLLKTESHDIDVAINKMTGYQFGLRLKEYLEKPGNAGKYGLEGVATTDKQSQKAGATDKSKLVGGLHKIEANPEKSKHLETLTMRVLGLDLDFVNLRKEIYDDNSRNPQMEFGTAEEDAMRRDATVNAMFYNINTEEIEDFTNRGHEDMEKKILRTPLEPYQTFKDDPLRILRLIRFASRLGYTIDKQAMVAMKDPGIKEALRSKISRERVGVELEKALRSSRPYEALRLVFELGLYETIFSCPDVAEADSYRPDTDGWRVMIDTLKEMLDKGETLAELLMRDDEERYMAWQLSAVVPYRDAPLPEVPTNGRRAPPMVVERVVREGIKGTNKVTDIIVAAVRNQEDISTLVDRAYERKRRPDKVVSGEDASSRDILGMAIRRWGPSWRSQVMYSCLVEVVENQDSVDGKPNNPVTQDYNIDLPLVIGRKYTAFTEHLQTIDLLSVTTLKPLLDGKALAKTLNTPPGPWMKEALDVVMAWQLRHPGVTDPSEAIEEVKRKRGELPHALVRHFLKLTIRPLFAKTKLSGVTAQGRKVTSETLPQRAGMAEDEEVAKPWKSGKDAQALDLLRWVVQTLDAQFVEELWPLIVPPLLTLLDDWETPYKLLGTQLLHQLLHIVPPPFLDRTGLGSVFSDALQPCLTALPPITPERESIDLLSAVYPTLTTLTLLRYPTTPLPGRNSTSEPISAQRTTNLDALLRKGILQGLVLSHDSPAVQTVLFQQLVPLLNTLGLESVKHLTYLLEIITPTLSLSSSSRMAEPRVLLAAVKALQAVVLNCWPRVAGYRGDVLKGVVLCWIGIDGLTGEEIGRLRRELREVVCMLRAAVGAGEQEGGGFEEELGGLVGAEGRLEDLFAETDAETGTT
ncbi:hypothetical protein LTR62_002162 [Meristemomyces frigidus]|uniref:Poly A polymerase C-terminal region-like protein n=1 Tax=Meristemomyces frigidus TaxID=1508187 RepID=A0AAN7TFA7_9PEZI|nr:hypothetical protein LTR62_002162 [Meristemomyces frigidus]